MVLDTSAFIAGFDPFSLGDYLVTSPLVKQEIKDPMTALRFETAAESGRLWVQVPPQEVLERARAVASTVGDAYLLSETDMHVLALALQLKEEGKQPRIVTDDYSIQNVATKMQLQFNALATHGIKRLLNWIRYCPACHKTYSANTKTTTCTVCGTQLKRKPQKTRKNPQK
ncbi:MAG: DNA-binding protein [Candidatus Bathyarchaeota archaeon]|nr:DNA-binding protein [Candidatus Bathyarchaeota archaeon]